MPRPSAGERFLQFQKELRPGGGVLHCWADGEGGQKVGDTGPLTKKRVETVDDEAVGAAKGFIDKANKDGKPFFVWVNTTHMHAGTHGKPSSMDKQDADSPNTTT